jgi:hypothetical protein
MTTMTEIQTNKIDALLDTELDQVAGGFSLSQFKYQVTHAISSAIQHPVDNLPTVGFYAKNALNNFLSLF